MFSIATTFNSPDQIAIPPNCLQFEVPTNSLLGAMFAIATTFNSPDQTAIYPQTVNGLKCPQIHLQHTLLFYAK